MTMGSTLSAKKNYTCARCHREVDAQVHLYAGTREVLVFGHICQHCRKPSEELNAFIRSIDEHAGPLTVHYAELNSVWCLHCDRPTQVEGNSMQKHIRNVHPAMSSLN